MKTLLQNARYCLRLLRKNPGFSAVAVITLALGIGANSAIFSVIYAVLLAPLPYKNPDQLVMVWSKIQGNNNVVSAGDFLDWKRNSTVFQELVAWTGAAFNFATSGEPERIVGRASTPGAYRLVGTDMFLGRDFLPEEGELGKDHVVILTHRLWERLGGDREIVGKQMKLDGQPYTVVGVTPPGQADRLESQFQVPLAFRPEQVSHDTHWLLVIGRLKPGVSIAQAQSNMDLVTSQIAQEHPTSNHGWGASVEALHNDFFPRESQQILWLLMAAVGLVLLIACANVANLVLAKGTTRLKEAAVRTSLGATRWDVFGQFLTESLVLAGIGGLLGIGLASLLIRILVLKLPPDQLPSEAEITLNMPVLFFTVAATTLAGVLFGCAPAWHAAKVDPNETLKEGGRSGPGASRNRLRKVLVVSEFALALTLLSAAGLALHSLWKLSRVDLGIQPDHLLTFGLTAPREEPRQPAHILSFYRQVLDRVQTLPGVINVEAENGMPLRGTGIGMPFSVAGQTVTDPAQRPAAMFLMATPSYYKTLAIPLTAGREFTERDSENSTRVAIVNEAFAKKYLAGVDPLHQRLLIERLVPGQGKIESAVGWQIVGVSRDIRNGGIRGEGYPEIAVPFAQSPWPEVNIVVRTAQDPGAMGKMVANAVHSINAEVALEQIRTMDDIVDESLITDRFSTALFGGFAVLALVLAGVGIYGVMAFAVAQRTHELGLRIALGARHEDVIQLVLREGLVLAGIGLAVGLLGAYAAGRALSGLLYGVGSLDLPAIAAVAIILLTAAFVACYIPARRAAGVDPMAALRYE